MYDGTSDVIMITLPLIAEETHVYPKYVFPTLVNVYVPSMCLLSTHDLVKN